MAGLLHTTTGAVQADRQDVAREYAQAQQVTVVLKGDRTVVTDGDRLYVNYSGNPGMATAGAGDVLAGVVGALRSRSLDPFNAAALGVYLHGLAGDLAVRGSSQDGICADDLLASVPAAVARYGEG
jgi:NAD(P)H-hydrate epimerase